MNQEQRERKIRVTKRWRRADAIILGLNFASFMADSIMGTWYALLPLLMVIGLSFVIIAQTRQINQLKRSVDWNHVRRMELEAYDTYFHTSDGTPIPEEKKVSTPPQSPSEWFGEVWGVVQWLKEIGNRYD